MFFPAQPIAELFARVKYPYNVNGPTQQEVIKRLETEPHDAHVLEVIAQRNLLAEALKKMPCIQKVYESDANFLLVKVTDADAIYEHLVKQGIIVRNRNRVAGCEGCLRITVGTCSSAGSLIIVPSRSINNIFFIEEIGFSLDYTPYI